MTTAESGGSPPVNTREAGSVRTGILAASIWWAIHDCVMLAGGGASAATAAGAAAIGFAFGILCGLLLLGWLRITRRLHWTLRTTPVMLFAFVVWSLFSLEHGLRKNPLSPRENLLVWILLFGSILLAFGILRHLIVRLTVQPRDRCAIPVVLLAPFLLVFLDYNDHHPAYHFSTQYNHLALNLAAWGLVLACTVLLALRYRCTFPRRSRFAQISGLAVVVLIVAGLAGYPSQEFRAVSVYRHTAQEHGLRTLAYLSGWRFSKPGLLFFREAAWPCRPAEEGERLLPSMRRQTAIEVPAEWESSPPPRRVLFILVDALRADYLDPTRPEEMVERYGWPPELFRDSLAFTRAHSFAANTGNSLPLLLGRIGYVGEDRRHWTILETAIEREYRTGVIAESGMYYYFKLLEGKDVTPEGESMFDLRLIPPPADGDALTPAAGRMAAEAIDYIDRQGDYPWLLYVHFNDLSRHWRQWGLGLSFDAATMQRDYSAYLQAITAAIGKILNHLHAAGIADDTLTIVVGDHGELLGEHGISLHANTAEPATLNVPLLLHRPGMPAHLSDRPMPSYDLPVILARQMELEVDPKIWPEEPTADARAMYAHYQIGVESSGQRVVWTPWWNLVQVEPPADGRRGQLIDEAARRLNDLPEGRLACRLIEHYWPLFVDSSETEELGESR